MLSRFFHTVAIQLEIDNDEYTQYEGSTPENVVENYEEQNSMFNFNVLSYKRTRKILNPFNQTCIGIESSQSYSVKLIIIRLDFYKLTLFFVGLLTFWYAAQLSNNSIFYYISGIFLGIFASFLFLVYLLSKLFPKRPAMYGILIGGSTIAVYILQMVWDNIQLILRTYQAFVFWYIVITGLISFVICYRFGPPKNQKSKNLIKWGLQLAGLTMIFWSSEYQDASSAVICITLISYYFPRRWLNKVRAFYLHKFPPKPRLLSNEEYYEQGVRETSKALEQLRSFCNSPECKQWRMVAKLKNPQMFASFVEGSSHISDNEILDYEASRNDVTDSELSDDEDNGGNGRLDNNEDDDISEDEDQNYPETYNLISNLKMSKETTPKNGVINNENQGNYSYERKSSKKIIYKSYDQEYSDED